MSENLNVVSRPSQVLIEDVRISAAGGELSLLGQVVSIDIYESIFSPFMTGNMLIADGVSFMKTFPITGREIITIFYKTPLDRGDIKELKMQIVSQISRARTEKRTDTIQLRLLSPTGFLDLNQSISGSYEGTNSEIVTNICDVYYQKEVEVDETYGTAKYALPFRKPSEHICNLGKQSYSYEHDHTYSGYLFYETRSGLKFKSLTDLYTQQPSADDFYLDAKVDRGNFEMDDLRFKTHIMVDVVFPRGFDRPYQISGGGFGGVQYTIDPTQKSWGSQQISYRDSPIPQQQSEVFNPIIANTSSLNDTGAKVYLSNRQSQNINETQNTSTDIASTDPYSRINYMLHADTAVNFTISGNSTLEAGKTVELVITKNAADMAIEESEFDDEKSGAYLIKSLHNKFYFPSDGKTEMKTSLQCVRNFRGEVVPDTVSTGNFDNE